jgi:hypothetical protein
VSAIERALAIVRDVMLIIVLTGVIIVGGSAMSAVHSRIDWTPNVQSTPTDQCGDDTC